MPFQAEFLDQTCQNCPREVDPRGLGFGLLLGMLLSKGKAEGELQSAQIIAGGKLMSTHRLHCVLTFLDS